MAVRLDAEVLIVGSGPAGLATAACLRRRAVPFLVLEQAAQVAPAWRSHYDRLHLHTTGSSSALPYQRFPPGTPRYPSRQEVVEYLERYAERFEVRPVLGQSVREVRPDGRDWVTRTQDRQFVSRSVVIATGFTRRPHRPVWPGLSTFRGPVLHSSEYRNGAAWAGKRVLVVGLGNSGGEIALDLLEHGAKPALSIRGALNVVPRDFLGVSMAGWARVLQHLPLRVADAIGRTVARVALGPLEPLGLSLPPGGAMTGIQKQRRIPLIDVGTIAALRRGAIELRPGVESFSNDEVRFADGSVQRFDALVLATGYRPSLDELFAHHPALSEEGLPVKGGADGLHFCGFHVAPTGMFREIAREARAIARRIASSR